MSVHPRKFIYKKALPLLVVDFLFEMYFPLFLSLVCLTIVDMFQRYMTFQGRQYGGLRPYFYEIYCPLAISLYLKVLNLYPYTLIIAIRLVY